MLFCISFTCSSVKSLLTRAAATTEIKYFLEVFPDLYAAERISQFSIYLPYSIDLHTEAKNKQHRTRKQIEKITDFSRDHDITTTDDK